MFVSSYTLESEKEVEIAFKDYYEMELLFEKLKSLNYYSEFVIPSKVKPLHKYYFMINTNHGEHFSLFCMLATWLIRKSGKQFEEPQEFEDPNNTIARFLNVVREDGITIDFPPNKLKQGTGRHIIFILNKLCDEALKRNKIKLSKPEVTDTEENNEQVKNENIMDEDDEAEIVLDHIEEDMYTYSDYSDDDIQSHDFAQIENVQHRNYYNMKVIDEELWQKELERVNPLLHVSLRHVNNNNWNLRLKFMQDNYCEIKKAAFTAKTLLSKIQKRVGYNLEKIKNREKHLNKEFHSPLKDYISKLNTLSKIKEDYSVLGSGVNEKMRNLSILNQTLENYKEKADIRGSYVTDGTPLVNIKRGLSKLKSEMVNIDEKTCILLVQVAQQTRRNTIPSLFYKSALKTCLDSVSFQFVVPFAQLKQ